jgi:hypothetical protein
VTSTFSWLDLHDEEAQRVREALAAFDDQGMIDPLGFGMVRDAFGEILFPGVSTVQTRARYFVLVPWIYRQLNTEGIRPSDGPARSRELELGLIESLLKGSPDREGIIGRDARRRTKQLPSFIYWGGLGRWGIRRFDGSRQEYFQTLGRRPAVGRTESEDEAEPVRGPWHGDLPDPPDELYEATSLQLTSEESDFITGRILNSVPDSYLAQLVRDGSTNQDADAPWEHPVALSSSSRLRLALHHGRLFSLAAWGAGLLYNVELSRLLEEDGGAPLSQDFDEAYSLWTANIRDYRADFKAWDRDGFWSIVTGENPNIPERVQRFVDWWLDVVVSGPPSGWQDRTMVKGLREREAQLKGARAKLANRRARERSPSAQGADRMLFRWPTARRLIRDLHEGADRAEPA